MRGGRVIPLKDTVDSAVQGLDYVKRVYVASRTGAKVNMQRGRDLQLQEVSHIHCLTYTYMCVCVFNHSFSFQLFNSVNNLHNVICMYCSSP